jgi:phage host-nuclease inhibitor protein Gam
MDERKDIEWLTIADGLARTVDAKNREIEELRAEIKTLRHEIAAWCCAHSDDLERIHELEAVVASRDTSISRLLQCVGNTKLCQE